jgi:hypothetical protein
MRANHHGVDIFDFQSRTIQGSFGCNGSVAETQLLFLDMTEFSHGKPDLDDLLLRIFIGELQELLDQPGRDRKLMHDSNDEIRIVRAGLALKFEGMTKAE